MAGRLVVLLAVFAAALTFAPAASAISSHGTSVFEEGLPAPPGDKRSLRDRFPQSSYGLDWSVGEAGVGVGSTDVLGVPVPTSVDADPNFDKMLRGSAHLGADVIWGFTRLISTMCVDALSWAFKVELFDGGGGMLGVASTAARNLYRNISGPLLPLAALAAGGWFMYGMVRGRIGQSVGSIVFALMLFAGTMWILTQPQQTIGVASDAATDLSKAAISAPAPRRDHGDEAFRMLVVRPWLVLEFGGVKRCFDKDGRPASGHGSDCRRGEVDMWDRFGKRMLYFGPSNSRRRIEELTAISKGDGKSVVPICKSPGSRIYPCDDNPQSDGTESARYMQAPLSLGLAAYRPRKDEVAAADMASGQASTERALMAGGIALFSVPQWLLIGGVAVVLLLLQLVAVALFMFAPVALVAAMVPGRGHALLINWLKMLFGAVVGKVVLSLGLGVVMVTLSALQGALPAGIGWMFAFALSSALCLILALWLPGVLKLAAKRSVVAVPPPVQNFAASQPQNVRNRFGSPAASAGADGAGGKGDDGSLRSATIAMTAKVNPEAAAAKKAADMAGTGDGRPPGSKAPDARPGAPAPPKAPGGPQSPSDVRQPVGRAPLAQDLAAARGPAAPAAVDAEKQEAARREALRPLEPGEKTSGRPPLSHDLEAARGQTQASRPSPQPRPVRNEPHASSVKLSDDLERARRAEAVRAERIRKPLPEPGQ